MAYADATRCSFSPTSATAALFRLDRANVKSKYPADPTKLVLSGLQRTEGVEIGVQGQVTKSWQVYDAYTNLDARVLKATAGGDNNIVVGSPRSARSAQLTLSTMF